MYFEPEDTHRFTPMSGMNTELDYINFLSMPKLLTRMIGLPVEATTTWQPRTEEEAAALAARMREFPHVALKGLMAIPPVSEFPGENCRYFAEMRNLFVDIKAKKYDNVSMECLSMGMSDDFTDAIAEGSTMVRIGTAIFGKRNYNT